MATVEVRHHGLIFAIDNFTDKPGCSVSVETRAILLAADENDEERCHSLKCT